MQLLDRYLTAVGTNLPKAQRDDILKELAENIRAQMDDKQAELGRPLTEAEQEAILRQHGNPLVVAGRYRHDDRSLTLGRTIIGAALFPFYIKVLWFNLGISAFVAALIILVLAQAGQPISPGGAIASLFWTLAAQLVVITGIFAAIDRHCAAHPDQWDLSNPRESGFSRLLGYAETDGGPHVSRFESASYFVAGAVFLSWFRVVVRSPRWVFGASIGAFRIQPIWHGLYVPFVLLIFASMIRAAINFVRPDWVLFRTIARAILGVAGIAILFMALRAGNILAISYPTPTAAEIRVAHAVNNWFFFGVFAATVAAIASLMFRIHRWSRELRKPSNGVRTQSN
jgi:hypothetical protein